MSPEDTAYELLAGVVLGTARVGEMTREYDGERVTTRIEFRELRRDYAERRGLDEQQEEALAERALLFWEARLTEIRKRKR